MLKVNTWQIALSRAIRENRLNSGEIILDYEIELQVLGETLNKDTLGFAKASYPELFSFYSTKGLK